MDDPILRAQKAKAILDDSLIQEVFDGMLDAIVKEWLMAQTSDVREACWAKQKNLEAFKKQFRKMVDTGTIAKKRT